MKKLLLLILLILVAPAIAGPFTAGQKLLAADLNAALAAPTITGGSIYCPSIGSSNPITAASPIGTAPFIVTSTTPVNNLSVGGTSGNVTGIITVAHGGTGVTTSTGTGSVVLSNAPVFTGVVSATGGITSITATASNQAVIYGQMPIVGTTAAIGGAALLAGACASTTTTVTGATAAMTVTTSPTIYPGDGGVWESYVSAANTIITKVCAIIAMTPASSTYNLRVIQ